MVKSCCAKKCKRRFEKGSPILFYRFPQNGERRQLWIKALKRSDWDPKEHSWLCSEHFVSGRKNDDPLHPDYIPSVFSFQSHSDQCKKQAALEKYNRAQKRKMNAKQNVPMGKTPKPNEKQRSQAAVDEAMNCQVDEPDVLVDIVLLKTDVENTEEVVIFNEEGNTASTFECQPMQTEMTVKSSKTLLEIKEKQSATKSTDFTAGSSLTLSAVAATQTQSHAYVQTEMRGRDISAFQIECSNLREEKMRLKEQILNYEFSEEVMGKDVKKMEFYTGFKDFSLLKAVFAMIKDGLNCNMRCRLPQFQQLVMTLMKLRFAFVDVDLSYRFLAARSTICKTFNETLAAMYAKLKPLIAWPDREELCTMVASGLQSTSNNFVCIVDVSEVCTDMPSNLKARAHLWSDNMQQHTIKFLVAMTPKGRLSFVSKCWGGSVTDKELVENCGITDFLQPGDRILATRGFNLKDGDGPYCVELIAPPLTNEKPELMVKEIAWSRDMSSIGARTERVIGELKRSFSILKGPMPNGIVMHKDSDGVPDADKMVSICCALYNLKNMTIAFETVIE